MQAAPGSPATGSRPASPSARSDVSGACWRPRQPNSPTARTCPRMAWIPLETNRFAGQLLFGDWIGKVVGRQAGGADSQKASLALGAGTFKCAAPALAQRHAGFLNLPPPRRGSPRHVALADLPPRPKASEGFPAA